MSPAASPRPTFSDAKPGPDCRPTSANRPSPSFRSSSLRCASVAPGPEVAGAVHHVAVDDGEVEVAVEVEVGEQRAEADVGERGDADSAPRRRVLEESAAEIAEQRMGLELVVGHEQIEAPSPS